jgi:two-component system response regulator RegA
MGVALFVDDDPVVLAYFRRGFSARDYDVHIATTALAGRRLTAEHRPDVAVVDLRIGNDWGIELIRELKSVHPRMRVFLVSGYVSVAATAEAIRAGAEHVFFKPVTAGELALVIEGRRPTPPPRDEPASLARATYEHVSRVLVDSKGNVSEAARRLGVHRQTVQRYLKKIPRA